MQSYLYWRLGHTPWDALWIAFPLLLIASFPFKRLHRIQRKLIFLSLGVVTYLVLATLLRDAYFLVSGQLLARGWVLLTTVTCVLAGTIHALLGPHVKRVTVEIDKLPADLEGFTIAQISDLHIGPTIGAPYVAKVVGRTNALAPDLIALTGDIGDGPVRVYRQDARELGQLQARHGVVCVSGNHEHYWGVDDWMKVMEENGVRVLKNTVLKVQHGTSVISVAGIPDPVSRISPAWEELEAQASGSDFKVLLSHRPGVARQALLRGFQLQLSGHTHGGQFFPWTLVVKFVHEFDRGLSRLQSLWIYVNVGTGSWGPFLRLGSTSEITLLRLVKNSESSR